MKKALFILATFLTSGVFAQSPIGGSTELVFEPQLAPFYHGVASGDPTSTSVIIWTRITPDTDAVQNVNWKVCTDTAMQNIVATGTATTDLTKDYTVKVDVTGLSPQTTYYYYFESNNAYSIVGRTRTAPTSVSENLKFAVVSCSNYEHGYFNVYERISERNDLDAVIHLGDYIYEYDTSTYASNNVNRANVPVHEIVEIDDYRTRYSLYRLDPQLRSVHQQQPFICIWDDHETANDAYVNGAQNHNPSNEYKPGQVEGDWSARKQAAKSAYLEWMPIRESQTTIYRKAQYGNLAEIWLLDTRIEGREEQPANVLAAAAPYRTILGQTQRDWLIDELKNTTSTWKVIANQVIFSPLNVGFAAGFGDGVPDPTNIDSINTVESIFMDIWDGYPQERSLILDSIEANGIDNIIILSGDFHSTFAFDVTDTPCDYPNPAAFNLPTPNAAYNPATGSGSKAVEFVTPSVTSANFDENVGPIASAQFELSFNSNVPTGNPLLPTVNYNPHMKYTDLDQHGYFVLDLKADSAQADWYFVNSILDQNDTIQAYGKGYYTVDGGNHLIYAPNAAAPKPQQEIPAPNAPFAAVSLNEFNIESLVLGVYPNPAKEKATLHYAINTPGNIEISLLTFDGKTVQGIVNKYHEVGVYQYSLNTSKLAAGTYQISIKSAQKTSTGKILIIE
jgi:alkaline phosphatase D